MSETQDALQRRALDALRFFGYLDDGTEPTEAAEAFRADFLREPDGFLEGMQRMFTSFILEFFFNISPEELLAQELELGASGDARNVQQGSTTELEAGVTVRNISGNTRERIAAMAESLIGQRENGGANRGAIVRLVMEGREGRDQLWCGGFTNFIMDKVHPGLFDQRDFVSARSFEREAIEHNAFHAAGDSYIPQVGDVIVFDRGGNGRGHVGIVTAVENGRLTYVSGNDQNAVRERSFPVSNPPSSLIGYADVETLAANKNIDLDRSVENASQHPSGLPASLVAAVRNAGLSIAA